MTGRPDPDQTSRAVNGARDARSNPPKKRSEQGETSSQTETPAPRRWASPKQRPDTDGAAAAVEGVRRGRRRS